MTMNEEIRDIIRHALLNGAVGRASREKGDRVVYHCHEADKAAIWELLERVAFNAPSTARASRMPSGRVGDRLLYDAVGGEVEVRSCELKDVHLLLWHHAGAIIDPVLMHDALEFKGKVESPYLEV